MVLTEGPIGRIEAIRVTENTSVPQTDIVAHMQSRLGEPYVPATVFADRDSVEAFLRDLGFRNANPEITPDIAPPVPGSDVRNVTLNITPNTGPKILVGDITVVGNRNVTEQTIREEMTLREGEPYSDAARFESRRRLNELGVFRRLSIDAEALAPGETNAHVIVTVDEAPRTTTGYGGGVQAEERPRAVVGGGTEDHMEIVPRGFFDIGRRNLWGKNRAVNFFSRVSVGPRSVPDNPALDGKGYHFREYRVAATYNAHRAFGTNADFLVGATAEQAIRTGFSFDRNEFSSELSRRVTRRVRVSGRYALDFTHQFNVNKELLQSDVAPVDRLFPNVRLSILSNGLSWDRRDHPLTPAHGTLVSADTEIALRPMGSQVGYSRDRRSMR